VRIGTRGPAGPRPLHRRPGRTLDRWWTAMSAPDYGTADYAVVIPTVGRDSLPPLLAAIADGPGPLPREVVLVNDRPGQPLAADVPAPRRDRLRVLAGDERGPAAARNLGWQATTAGWVVFVDDDVAPDPGWRAALADDLLVAPTVGAVAGHIHVPLPARM